mgnify:CR=1 FL=1|jgi:hypothetical protein|tara:strand:+ start:12613 stop:12801 length:189 start_codon:yes stop_codon:yes gene_type:complete
MAPEQEQELHAALVNHITSNLTFAELIDIISTLVKDEVDRKFENMSEEEKLQSYNEIFKKEV